MDHKLIIVWLDPRMEALELSNVRLVTATRANEIMTATFGNEPVIHRGVAGFRYEGDFTQ